MRELGILRIFIDYDLLLFQPHHVNGLQVMDESHERIGRWLGAREVCGHHFRPSFVRETTNRTDRHAMAVAQDRLKELKSELRKMGFNV